MGLNLLLAFKFHASFLSALLILAWLVCWEVGRCEDQSSGEFSDLGEDELLPWSILRPHPHKPKYKKFNVLEFGAKADGSSDDSEAFLDAWSAACQSDYSILLIPGDKTFLLQPTKFSGPCGLGMRVQLDGTLVAPSPDDWGTSNYHQWLSFVELDNFTMQGDGKIDGNGEEWWEQSCKINQSNPCHPAPTAVTISKSNNTIVRHLNFVNAQQMHLSFDTCTSIHAKGLNISAPRKSPNTDGIHLHATQNAVIEDCVIGTGDDCISIQTGSFRVRIKNVTCGPGHGISIGSLGKGGGAAAVAAVIVDGAVLNGTTNGLRIKSWQGGQGYVYGVRYHNIRMIDVANPIIIDQYYCDSPEPCQNQTSAVEVSGIMYKNITGTSATAVAVRFACSDTVACHHLVLQDVELLRTSGLRNVSSFCENAMGIAVGNVTPNSCLI